MTDDERFAIFRRECAAAGLTVREYRGRNFYVGPAVECDDKDALTEAIRACTVPVQYDQLGRGYILYPKHR